MKKYVVCFSLVICSMALMAQRASISISGNVYDIKGNALSGASVSIKDSYLGVFTDSHGTFAFDKISQGSYTLVVSYLGFYTKEQNIQVFKDTTIAIVLVESALKLKPVMVTAIRAQETAPFALTNISKANIQEQNIVRDIPYQLELTPSVVATSDNGTGIGYTGMRIRGTDMSRINITVNGIPLNDSESQTVFWVNMADFSSSVDEVQIQRGVGTSTNGAASFGASVNFQTIAIQEEAYAQVSSSIGSFQTFKENISAGTGIIDSSWFFGIRASKLNSDGWVQRGFSDHSSMHATGSYFNGNHLFTSHVMLGKEKTGISWEGLPSDMLEIDRTYNVTGMYYDDNGNVQFYDNETDNYWQNHYSLAYNYNASPHLKLSATIHATTGKGYYEQYKDNAKFSKYNLQPVKLTDTLLTIGNNVYVFPDSTIKRSDLIRQKWLQNVFYGYNTSINYKKDNIDASIGHAFNIYSGDHFGKVIWAQYLPDMQNSHQWYFNVGEKKDVNVFAKLQYQINKELSVYGDIQYRNIEYKIDGVDDDFSELNHAYVWNFVNPKAGLFYKIDKKSSVYTSFAVANREPGRSELKDAAKMENAKQIHHETLYDYEFGYQFAIQKVGVGINFYNMMYDNQLVLTGKLNDVGDPIMENVKDSYRRGLELTIGARPAKEIAWNANITLSQNKILNYTEVATNYDDEWNEEIRLTHIGTTNISYSPNVVAANSIMFYPHKTMNFGITSKYVGEQFFDNTSHPDRKLDSYIIHNFIMNYTIPCKKSRKLGLQLMVNNLLNAEYISNAYGGNWYEQGQENSWMYYYPQAGINYMFKATFDF